MPAAGATASKQVAAPVLADEQEFVLFSIAEETFTLPRREVAEILPLPSLSRPAHLPPITEGLLDLGGRIIPVVRLRALLGFEPSMPGIYAHLILVDGSIALLADRVIDCATVPVDQLRSLEQGGIFRDCVTAELTGFPYAVHVLDLERLLKARERKILEALSECELDRRLLFEGEK